MEQAAARGIPIVVFRVCCWLSGDSKTGITPTAQNHLLSLVKGCVQMHCAPNWSSLRINMLPINTASRFVVDATSHQETLCSPVYNICNLEEISWTSFIEWMNKTYSFGITLIEPKEWYEQLKELDAENAIYPFLPHYLSCPPDKPVIQMEREVDDRSMRAVMRTMNLEYPKPDDHLLRVYFEYLLSGFISPSLHLDCQAAEQILEMGMGTR